MKRGFEWEGTRLRTAKDLIAVLVALPDRAAGERLMTALEAHDPEARNAVGYLAGFCPLRVCWRIHYLTATTYPTRGWPTFDSILQGTMYS